MSSKKGEPDLSATLGVENFKRRTWDEEEYKRKRFEREERERSGKVKSSGGDGSQYLAARDSGMRLDRQVGARETVLATADRSEEAGFRCEVCDYITKDHKSYLDHCNSRLHQRNIGNESMNVQRSSVADVKERLMQTLKRKATEAAKGSESKSSKKFDYNELIKSRQEAEERERESIIAKKKQKIKDSGKNDANNAEEDEGIDPELKAMMGFTSFGSSKK